MIDVDPKVLSNSLNVTSYIVGDISNVFFKPFLVVKFIIFGRTQVRPEKSVTLRICPLSKVLKIAVILVSDFQPKQFWLLLVNFGRFRLILVNFKFSIDFG